MIYYKYKNIPNFFWTYADTDSILKKPLCSLISRVCGLTRNSLNSWKTVQADFTDGNRSL